MGGPPGVTSAASRQVAVAAREAGGARRFLSAHLGAGASPPPAPAHLGASGPRGPAPAGRLPAQQPSLRVWISPLKQVKPVSGSRRKQV